MQTIGLSDTLTIGTSSESGIHLQVIGEMAHGIPSDNNNLVCRAVRAILDATGNSETGLSITLDKRIPAQAGLGGGSSDAAAALVLTNRLLNTGLKTSELMELGCKIGADIPFLILGGTARVEGLGEIVQPIKPLSRMLVIVVKPPVSISTALAYKTLDSERSYTPAVTGKGSTGSFEDAHAQGKLGRLSNVFQDIIFKLEPRIADAHRIFTAITEYHGAVKPIMTGSGSALYTITHDHNTAEQIASSLDNTGIGEIWLTETKGGSGAELQR